MDHWILGCFAFLVGFQCLSTLFILWCMLSGMVCGCCLLMCTLRLDVQLCIVQCLVCYNHLSRRNEPYIRIEEHVVPPPVKPHVNCEKVGSILEKFPSVSSFELTPAPATQLIIPRRRSLSFDTLRPNQNWLRKEKTERTPLPQVRKRRTSFLPRIRKQKPLVNPVLIFSEDETEEN